MSKRIEGYSQDMMRAIWKDFVQRELRRTRFRTPVNGVDRNVYHDDKHLIVLDEWHGDLELLEMQRKPGRATHVGSQEIDVVAPPPDLKLERGTIKWGGKHRFELKGSF